MTGTQSRPFKGPQEIPSHGHINLTWLYSQVPPRYLKMTAVIKPIKAEGGWDRGPIGPHEPRILQNWNVGSFRTLLEGPHPF